MQHIHTMSALFVRRKQSANVSDNTGARVGLVSCSATNEAMSAHHSTRHVTESSPTSRDWASSLKAQICFKKTIVPLFKTRRTIMGRGQGMSRSEAGRKGAQRRWDKDGNDDDDDDNQDFDDFDDNQEEEDMDDSDDYRSQGRGVS